MCRYLPTPFLMFYLSVLKVLCSSASHVRCNDEMTGFIKSAAQVGMGSKKQKAKMS